MAGQGHVPSAAEIEADQRFYEQYEEGRFEPEDAGVAIDAVPVVVDGKTVLKYRVPMGDDAVMFDSYADALEFANMMLEGED